MSCLYPHYVHMSLLVYENSTTSFQLLLAACDATAGWAGVSYMPFLTPRGEDGATCEVLWLTKRSISHSSSTINARHLCLGQKTAADPYSNWWVVLAKAQKEGLVHLRGELKAVGFIEIDFFHWLSCSSCFYHWKWFCLSAVIISHNSWWSKVTVPFVVVLQCHLNGPDRRKRGGESVAAFNIILLI